MSHGIQRLLRMERNTVNLERALAFYRDASGFRVDDANAAAPAWALQLAQELPDLRVTSIGSDLQDSEGLLAQRLAAEPGTVYLLRPDQHICARWRSANAQADQVRQALARAHGYTEAEQDAACCAA